MKPVDGLHTACFELARTIKWKQGPIDANKITALANRLTEIARDMESDALSIDLPLLERAVRYIHQAHGMPMSDNTDWFASTLQVLLEVARPNTGLSSESKAFLFDMMDGIKDSLAQE